MLNSPYPARMRIAIDARMMGPENTRGIGRYVEELIRAMLDVAPEHRYVLVTRTPVHPFVSHPSVETVVADIPWYGLREQLELTRILRHLHVDLIHFPHWNVPLLFRGSYVVTIHDLLLRHVPNSAKISTRHPFIARIKRLGFRLVLCHAISGASQILVPTNATMTDVITLYPQSKNKIVVTGEGMAEVKDEVVTNHQEPQGEDGYLLYVGAAYPHKGLQDVISAWPLIHARYPKLRLKIAGELDVFMKAVRENVVTSKLSHIEFLDRVSDEHLSQLFQQATAFVFPTHFEGFGLPPLEAIARGCPVICSDIPVMHEVLGDDVARFFRVGDSNAILQAVQEVVSDSEGAREKTKRGASVLAARHDWHRAAERTISAYKTAS